MTAEAFRACLWGGAIGDALGAPVEFLRRREILARFGDGGIQRYAPAYGGLGRITDDTQMTLFTAEGLLRGWVRARRKGTCHPRSVVASAYLRWLITQGRSPQGFTQEEDGWLFQQKELFSIRTPGNTCMSALSNLSELASLASNASKGCGGVMRVAPVGLFGARLGWSAAQVFAFGNEIAAITHGHPTGQYPAGVLAVLVWGGVLGHPLQDSLAVALALLKAEKDHAETLRALEKALSVLALPPVEALPQLGSGWFAESALAIALYCSVAAASFHEGIVWAVNHDGDSDSTAAIAGHLLALRFGLSSLPAVWLEPLELREVIGQVAQDLHDFPAWFAEVESEAVARYPGS